MLGPLPSGPYWTRSGLARQSCVSRGDRCFSAPALFIMKPVRTAQYRWPNCQIIFLLPTLATNTPWVKSPIIMPHHLTEQTKLRIHGMSSTNPMADFAHVDTSSSFPPAPRALCLQYVRWGEGDRRPAVVPSCSSSSSSMAPQYGSLRDREQIQPNLPPLGDMAACAPRGKTTRVNTCSFFPSLCSLWSTVSLV